VKVLLVNSSDRGGGAQQVGRALLEGLTARGHDASMAVGHTDGSDPRVRVIPNFEHRPRRAQLAAFAGHRVAGHGAKRLGDLLTRAGEPRRWARVARGDEDFDFPGTWTLVQEAAGAGVVHLHNLHGGYFDLRALPALSRVAPVVVTLHDSWLLTGHCAHSFECERWATGCHDCPHLSTYPALPRDRTRENWRRKRAIHAASRLIVVTPSAWLGERVDRSILAPAAIERHVIPNGIDLDAFRPGDRAAARAALGLPQDADVVLFAANWTASNDFKDFPTLETAMAHLGARRRARPLLLVSVGEAGPTRREGQAELRMVGHVGDPANLVTWYQAADLYVHPARADTFPTTVLEAMACGLPVVASAVGGIPEQVEAGVTGDLVPPGDAIALARAVDDVLGDDERRARMAASARSRAEAHYDVARMIDAHLTLYEQAAERR